MLSLPRAQLHHCSRTKMPQVARCGQKMKNNDKLRGGTPFNIIHSLNLFCPPRVGKVSCFSSGLTEDDCPPSCMWIPQQFAVSLYLLWPQARAGLRLFQACAWLSPPPLCTGKALLFLNPSCQVWWAGETSLMQGVEEEDPEARAGAYRGWTN